MFRPIAVAALLSLLPAAVAASGLTPPSDPPGSTIVDNAFFPDDTSTNVTDCVSSLPRPDCGSRERGGWRQGAVFGVIVVGLLGVGARLVIGVRRRGAGERGAGDDS